MTQPNSRATIYMRGDWGYTRVEARNIEIDCSGKSIQIFYIPKGKRSLYGQSDLHKHSVVILNGWGHPTPPSGWIYEGDTWKRSRYYMGSKESDKGFSDFLQTHLAQSNAIVLGDFREVNEAMCYPSSSAVDESDTSTSLPSVPLPTMSPMVNEESIATALFVEGAQSYGISIVYERHPEARSQCLAFYGRICKVCETDLKSVYGELGPEIIQVHHCKPLSEIGKAYVVNPIKDLVPVCPNCHSLLHQRTPPFSVSELRIIMVKVSPESDKL